MQFSVDRPRWVVLALSATLVGLALPAAALPANASEPRLLVAGLAPTPTRDVVVNKAITTSFDLALAQTHSSALTSFIASLSNTASPNYGHFLTPAQYATRFGASSATVHAVEHYFSTYGFRIGALSAGHDILHVTGTTGDIARAFDAPVETVRLSTGALDAHFTSSASLPSTLAHDVTAVAGLDSVVPESTNLATTHASASAVTAPTACPAAGSSTGTTPNSVGGYTVQQQAALYGFSGAWTAGDTGVGQTIGVYELATFDASDVQTFFNCYGLASTVSAVNVDGGPTNSDNAGNAPDEATLDVEETAALAPGATIEVYQGTNNNSGPTDTYTQMASNDTATIITTSWGVCEAQTDGAAQAEQTIFQEMAAQGQTVVAAAGDDGSSDCADTSEPTSAVAVDDPASQPYVTGVGGLDVANIEPLTESVWNDNCTQSDCGAGGGGASSLWSRPSWQVAPGISTSTGTMRMVPDLSVMGDPATGFIQYYTGTGSGFCRHSCSGGWGAIGGTSIGAPLVSDLIAVAAQACGVPRLGFVNPSLYAMATTGFVDVTTGNNDLYNVGEYSAGAGYDMASGLGTPNGAAFLSGLCPPKFSAAESTFAASSTTGVALSTGPTVTATLRSASNVPIANASVEITATAPSGNLSIDGIENTAATGAAASTVSSNADGVVSFDVESTIPQNVDVTITYEGQPIFTTTITFKAPGTAKVSLVPGAPTISTLVALVRGFHLIVKPPTSSGGSAITDYQYSINGGVSWAAMPKGVRSIDVTRLSKDHAYKVIARAVNVDGRSTASSAKRVVTRS
ncbi:MAG TPA: S53 family peptidase [Acidimicrobiales bacterium]|jgi:subtilase family serine protease